MEKLAIWHKNFGRIVHETHSGMGVDNTYAYNTFGRLVPLQATAQQERLPTIPLAGCNPPATQPLWAVVHVCVRCKLARGKSLAICTKKSKKISNNFQKGIAFLV